ncbi:homeodomain-containing protein [Aquabacter spiritensis]|uniref:Homeodomain-containing protein n=1 Tax=Aquabacter spiritensis TaxID=933073 RepID=A0A4R3LLN5_9HYPH|nr:homeodomain-containing protein [Aquabacter spiritensis]
MRYPASEKLEVIRIVEQSHLPAKHTLDQLGIPRRTFYRWYDRFLEGGPEALEDRPSAPSRVWNRIGDDIQDQIVEMALDYSELSPRELAVRFTDEKRYFVSEATVYRLLKAHDLITSPAYVVIKAADQFHTKTTRPNEMWQTDFTYFKLIGWGWMYLSTVLDGSGRTMGIQEQLREKIEKVEALYFGAGTAGERDAAEAASARLKAKLAEISRQDPPVEMQFSMPDPWAVRLFVALCRRYGIRPYRYPRQRRTTIMVRASRGFFDAVVWRQFAEMHSDLWAHFEETTDRLIRGSVHSDTRDAETLPTPIGTR